MEHRNLNNIINERAFFERILAERDKLESERDRRITERFDAQDESTKLALASASKVLTKSEANAEERLKQHNNLIQQMRDRDETYASKESVENLLDKFNNIHSDHIARREFDDLKKNVNEGYGSRMTLISIGAIVIIILTALFGVVQKSIPSNQEISNIVKTQEPWLEDKPSIKSDISILDKKNQQLEIQINRLDYKITLICSSLKPKPISC